MKSAIAICLSLTVCICLLAPAQQANRGPETTAQKAGNLYTTANSAYRTGQWDQARKLLERFVKVYATHEYVPVAYLQLASCCSRLKDHDSLESALDEVISRFPGSPAWFCAYGAKLGRAKAQKDHEKYLELLEALPRQAKALPLDLHGNLGRHYGGYYYSEYSQQGRMFEPTAGRMGSITRKPGWVMTIVQAADTPERAERALRAISQTLREREGDLPADWQFAHVLLLKKAGDAEAANAKFQAYLDEWGDDPRVIDLWLLRAQHAQAEGATKSADAIYDRLIESHAGSGSLAEPLRQRLWHLYHKDRYDEFTRLARHFLKTYPGSRWHDQIVGLWVGMAKNKAAKGDTSRVRSALEMLEGAPPQERAAGTAEGIAATKHPIWHRSNLIRRIDLHMLVKDAASAAALAEELIEKYWSAHSFQLVSAQAASFDPFKEVLEKARERYGIPAPDPDGRAAKLLGELTQRLKDDQTRHAEEIGAELISQHRKDAATIEAVKLLADYYFKKVLPEQRDKWMDWIIRSYPRHPLTQEVLANRITAENAARNYERLAEALDEMARRFPGTEGNWGWYQARLRCFDAAKDPQGKAAFVKRYYGARADAGEIEALRELARYEHAELGTDYKAIGDNWMGWAEKFAGTRAELYCLRGAWNAYYWTPYSRRQMKAVRWSEAEKVIKALQTQKHDPELRWKMAFADINLLAHRGKGAEALVALDERLRAAQTYRDLSLRLDFEAIGAAAAQSRQFRAGVTQADRLKKLCPSRRDSGAIELMLAVIHASGKSHVSAAEHYLNIVEQSPWPARRYRFFLSAMGQLEQARSPSYEKEMRRYMDKVSRVQELVPGLMFRLGYLHLSHRSAGVLKIRQALASRYPASDAYDRLNAEIAKRQ